jgi:hypothetical protein
VKKTSSNVVDIGSVGRAKLNDEVDELFKLPLAEFTDARNALAKRLKQSGRTNDADLVKTLTKPPVSAWTVNQLYWNHREEFDGLLAAGQRVRKAQVSVSTSKLADMRAALEARREALVELSELASSVLREAGSNPSPETLRRITTTLEAVSAMADGPTLGRLTQDVDPPGFESLTSFMAGTGTTKVTRGKTSQPAATATSQRKAATTDGQQKAVREAQQREELRQAKIAVAKITLQMAKKALVDARTAAQSLESQQKKATGEAKQAQKLMHEVEERFKKASAASEAATERAEALAEEAAAANKSVEDARRAVEKASKELETQFN